MSTPRDRGRGGDAPALHLVRDDDAARRVRRVPRHGTRGRFARQPAGPDGTDVAHHGPAGPRPARGDGPRGLPPHAHEPRALVALLHPPGAAVHAVAVVPRSRLGRRGTRADQHRDAGALREGRLSGLRQGARTGLRGSPQRPPADVVVPPAVPRERERRAGHQPRADHRHRAGAGSAAVGADGTRAQLRGARSAHDPRGDLGPLQRAGLTDGHHPPGLQRPGAAGAAVRHPDLPDRAPDREPAPLQARPRAGPRQQHRDASRAGRADGRRRTAPGDGRQRQPGPDAAEAHAEGPRGVAPAAWRRPG